MSALETTRNGPRERCHACGNDLHYEGKGPADRNGHHPAAFKCRNRHCELYGEEVHR